MKHHNQEPETHPLKTGVVIDLSAHRRRRGERRTEGKGVRRRESYDLPLVGPNRIPVDYQKAA